MQGFFTASVAGAVSLARFDDAGRASSSADSIRQQRFRPVTVAKKSAASQISHTFRCGGEFTVAIYYYFSNSGAERSPQIGAKLRGCDPPSRAAAMSFAPCGFVFVGLAMLTMKALDALKAVKIPTY